MNSSLLTLVATCLLSGLLLASAPSPATERLAGTGGVNAPDQMDKPYLVLVSVDGYRWDYPDTFRPPIVTRIIENGFRVERLQPVFPTLTFPNHYSIATGLYPDRHGIVGNYFLARDLGRWYELRLRETVEDGHFYNGMPLWVAAEQQGMVSAAFYFVGTEAAIADIRPTHWRSFSKQVSGEDRVDQVVAWLNEPEERRPHLVTLYFEDVDDHSHWSGVASAPALEAVSRVDRYLERLLTGLAALPHGDQVNIVVVSDHGQSAYLPDEAPLVLEDHIDLSGVRVIGRGAYNFLYYDEPEQNRIARDQEILKAAWSQGRVLTPVEAPPEWRIDESPRWPDLMVLPDPGYAVISRSEHQDRINPGAHGWVPEFRDMHGVMFGSGPAFKKGTRIERASVVDVYPLLMSVLGLNVSTEIDGNPEVLAPALVTP